jgi:hypothetical protein
MKRTFCQWTSCHSLVTMPPVSPLFWLYAHLDTQEQQQQQRDRSNKGLASLCGLRVLVASLTVVCCR